MRPTASIPAKRYNRSAPNPWWVRLLARQARNLEKRCSRLLGRGWGSHTPAKEVAQIGRFLPDVRLAVDGGAHVGNWTAALLKQYPQATVHAIEPAGPARVALRRSAGGSILTRPMPENIRWNPIFRAFRNLKSGGDNRCWR